MRQKIYIYKDIDGYIYYAIEEDNNLCYNTRRLSFNNLLIQRRLTNISNEVPNSKEIVFARYLGLECIGVLDLLVSELKVMPNIIRSLEQVMKK